MLVVRGTKKLRDRLRGASAAEDVSTTGLGDWFATVLFWKPQVALLVNERTFVPVFMPLAPPATLLDRIPSAIGRVLRLHGVDETFVIAEMAAMDQVRLASTNNRSVVGVMNELAFLGGAHSTGGVDDLEQLSLRLAGTPVGPLEDREGFPDRELAALTGSPPREQSRRLTLVPAPTSPQVGKTAEVFQLKVTLLDTKPPVWRRLLVAGDTTLDTLHEILQAALGWWDYHLHDFEAGEVRYGVPDKDDWDPPKDERRVRLDAIAAEGSRFHYVYDFGDNWRHRVVVEAVRPAEAAETLPACVDGRRACPPEDCGGSWGYHELLSILADPRHPEHKDRLEWLEDAFDPEAFEPGDFPEQLTLRRLARFDD